MLGKQNVISAFIGSRFGLGQRVSTSHTTPHLDTSSPSLNPSQAMAFSAARSPLAKVPVTTPLVARRTYVSATSIVDAKARVQERARRSISGSASKNVTPAPAA
jgi:hypothetical protein